MKNKALLFSLICLSYEYYQLRTSTDQKSITIAPAVFHTPCIKHLNCTKPDQYVHHEYLAAGSSIYLGKYKWCDSLSLPDDVLNNEDKPEDVEFEFIWKGRTDDFKTDGFHVVVDYSSSIFYGTACCSSEYVESYYPVYVLNETNETRYFIRKNDHVYAIQEAEDPYGRKTDEWWPVEYNCLDFSRDGWAAIKVNPGEFVLFIVPKYMGPTETRMRVRLRNGDDVILSDTYQGHINLNQFMAPPGTPLQMVIEKNDIGYIHFMFLGAFPKETLPGTDRWWRS